MNRSFKLRALALLSTLDPGLLCEVEQDEEDEDDFLQFVLTAEEKLAGGREPWVRVRAGATKKIELWSSPIPSPFRVSEARVTSRVFAGATRLAELLELLLPET